MTSRGPSRPPWTAGCRRHADAGAPPDAVPRPRVVRDALPGRPTAGPLDRPAVLRSVGHGRGGPSADTNIDPIVASITRQVHRPKRVVIRPTDGVTWPSAADAAIASAGIEVQVLAPGVGGPDWSMLESEETTEWLSLWPQGRPVTPTFPLDLLVGGEMSRADAVGYQPGEGFHFVQSLDLGLGDRPAGRSCADAGGWRQAFDVVSGTRLTDWDLHGGRFLSVGPRGSSRGRLPRSIGPSAASPPPRRVLVYGDVNLNLIDGSATGRRPSSRSWPWWVAMSRCCSRVASPRRGSSSPSRPCRTSASFGRSRRGSLLGIDSGAS